MNEEQAALLENRRVELLLIKASLEDLKEGSDLLIPLGVGIYAKAKLSDANEFLVNVGSNVIVKKSLDEVKEMIDKEIKEIEKLLE
jgi:prefoldin alpha subunit